MGIGLGQLIVVLLIILVLFGAGKLPQVMGELGKGLKAFKKNVKDDNSAASKQGKVIDMEKEKEDK